jgi:hypothetical protein
LDEKTLRSDFNPGFAVNLMHKLKIFCIFSRRSRLLREAPKYAVLTTRGEIFEKKKFPLGDAHLYFEVESQITRKSDDE